MTIDTYIYKAIKKAIEYYGNKSQFAKVAQIPRSMPMEYLRRFELHGNGWIQDETWERMYPALRPFLPDSYRYYPRSQLNNVEVADKGGDYKAHLDTDLIYINNIWENLSQEQKQNIISYINFIYNKKTNNDNQSSKAC